MNFGPKAERVFNALWKAGQGWDDSTYVRPAGVDSVIDEARPNPGQALPSDVQTAIKYAALALVDLASTGRADVTGVSRVLGFCTQHAPFAGPVSPVMTRMQLDVLLQQEPALGAVAAMLASAWVSGQR